MLRKQSTGCPHSYGAFFKLRCFVTINARNMNETRNERETMKVYLCF